ncbi:MAG: YicC family protein [Granulosicoccus sp.]|nr:YicC family protein [Granulosicoccus sp.]
MSATGNNQAHYRQGDNIMLRSMTAFGQARSTIDEGELVCEIRSVNHRFLDIGVRLDDALRSIEASVRDLAGARVSRGKLELSVRLNPSADIRESLNIDQDLLDELLQKANEFAERYPRRAGFDVVQLMQWPGVIRTESKFGDHVLQHAVQTVEQALEELLANRSREGEKIQQVLTDRARELQSIVARLREHRPVVVSAQREKLTEKLQQLATEFDRSRLEQELVHAAQRLDIDEELDRLDVHLDEMFEVFSRHEAVGRRMDFLMQELNREANTLGSKSNDSTTSAESVNMKVLIEQMREQIQNIE